MSDDFFPAYLRAVEPERDTVAENAVRVFQVIGGGAVFAFVVYVLCVVF